jgi:hypothetical protein
MKTKYLVPIIMLIGFFLIYIFKNGKIVKINTLGELNLRFLLDEVMNFDISKRTNKEDKDSIKNCQNSDSKYFIQYITGYTVSFNNN